MNKTLEGRFVAMDAFRGFASIMIVCFHVLPGRYPDYPTLERFIHSLRIGTDIFFVISGFGVAIAVQKVLRGERSIPGFLWPRVHKIYRLFFFSVITAALIIPAILPFLSLLKSGQLQWHFYGYTSAEWLKILTLTRVFDADSWSLNLPFLPMNGAYWFIAVLLQIYAVTGLALWWKRAFYPTMLALTALSLLCQYPPFKALIPYGLFLPKFAEFAVGFWLYGLILRYPQPAPAGRLGIIIGATALVALLLAVPLPDDAYRLGSALLIGLLFWFIYPYDGRLAGNPLWRGLLFVGGFSYSTYLMHLPLWLPMDSIVRNALPLPTAISAPLVLVPAIVFTCYLWNQLVEGRLPRRRRTQRSGPVADGNPP